MNWPETRVILRPATEGDMPFVLAGTRELASVEGRPDDVTVTESGLWRLLTTPGVAAECVVVERQADTGARVRVGHAWFFVHSSTFSGSVWLYLEDLVIRAEHRGRGLGRAVMGALACMARGRGCSGMHWSIVEGNDEAVRFYERLGAEPKTGSRQMKVVGEALDALAHG